MNANNPEAWEEDRKTAKAEIIDWLSENSDTSQKRTELETDLDGKLKKTSHFESIFQLLIAEPGLLQGLRALTRRDIGTSQIATFLGISTSTFEAIERGAKPMDPILTNLSSLLEKELDKSLAGWMIEKREPSSDEIVRAKIVAADRIIKRTASTELRYRHEPRQLDKLKIFLQSRNFEEIDGAGIRNPKTDIPIGKYAFRVNIEGKTIDGVSLNQNVDTLIMPHTSKRDSLPIFLEAKSMTDEVNPNKRQKEEAQKVDSVRRKWQVPGIHLNFILLLGGTVPRRYLEVEAGSGLDWIWEHRIEDLDRLLKWYK